jgi:hypothetical protein
MGKGEMGAAEFRKLLDHAGIVGRSVTGELSHLQLARSWSLSGDDAAAEKSYEDLAEYAALLKGVARTVRH